MFECTKTLSGTHMTQAIPSSSSDSMHDHGKPVWKHLPPFHSLPASLFFCLTHYLTLSLHLLFPFLNLKGDCVYSIFIILGGTVDRWDTCTITRAQHYLFLADRVKTHSLAPFHHPSLLGKGDIML